MVAIAIALIVVVVSNTSTSLLDLRVGDCFDLPVAGSEAARADDVEIVETVEVIGCDEPHEAEVVAVGELNPDGDLAYPSDDELFAAVDPRCAAASVPLDRFGIVPIAPTERSWESFDGRFLCLAIPFGGEPVTGSIVGSSADG